MAQRVDLSIGAKEGAVGISFTGDLPKGSLYALSPDSARRVACQLIEKAYIAEQLEEVKKREEKEKPNILLVDPIKKIRA